ncbi:hypothetical protein ABBQ38_012565 [Trebouxia sp. C0009 RCD-2024]
MTRGTERYVSLTRFCQCSAAFRGVQAEAVWFAVCTDAPRVQQPAHAGQTLNVIGYLRSQGSAWTSWKTCTSCILLRPGIGGLGTHKKHSTEGKRGSRSACRRSGTETAQEELYGSGCNGAV